jgi:hypothetical protein
MRKTKKTTDVFVSLFSRFGDFVQGDTPTSLRTNIRQVQDRDAAVWEQEQEWRTRRILVRDLQKELQEYGPLYTGCDVECEMEPDMEEDN